MKIILKSEMVFHFTLSDSPLVYCTYRSSVVRVRDGRTFLFTYRQKNQNRTGLQLRAASGRACNSLWTAADSISFHTSSLRLFLDIAIRLSVIKTFTLPYFFVISVSIPISFNTYSASTFERWQQSTEWSHEPSWPTFKRSRCSLSDTVHSYQSSHEL